MSTEIAPCPNRGTTRHHVQIISIQIQSVFGIIFLLFPESKWWKSAKQNRKFRVLGYKYSSLDDDKENGRWISRKLLLFQRCTSLSPLFVRLFNFRYNNTIKNKLKNLGIRVDDDSELLNVYKMIYLKLLSPSSLPNADITLTLKWRKTDRLSTDKDAFYYCVKAL